MKKLIFALSLFLFAGVAVNAQSKACCSKKEQASCCAKKASATKTASIDIDFKAADELAAADENIERRECAVSGKIAYFQKSETDGEVAWEEVSYDAEKKSFTRVAAATMEKDIETGKVMKEKKCAPKGKSCCAKKGKA